MSRRPSSVFREAAIERLSSPDQLDLLVPVTRPADWIGAVVIAAALLLLATWGFLGRVPTRVAGEGMVVGAGGLVEASTGIGGRLASVDVRVGEPVAAGQRLATLAQPDLSAEQAASLALLAQRERELRVLQTAAAKAAAAESASDAARAAAFRQTQAAARARADALAKELATTEGLVPRGLATQPELEKARADLAEARQRAADARNAELTLEADRLQRVARRDEQLRTAGFRLADAQREADRLGARLGRESVVHSPTAGRISEIRASAGTVLPAGAPVAIVETGRAELQAVVYLPPDEGKLVRPGMKVRLEPSTVRRDEYGLLLGRVRSVSTFPATSDAMTAVLHNPDLAARFRGRGAPYAAVVAFERDRGTPSGYRWSSRRGPPGPVVAGALVRADVETRSRRPVDLLLPLARRLGRGLGG